MSVKKAVSLFIFIVLGGALLVPISGCNPGANETNTPPPSEKELPLLDTLPHGPLETAYFALG
jgi:hypothetical protein